MGHVCVSFSALLLNSVMSAFRAEFIATRSMDFIGMIKECDESGFPKVGSWLNAQRRTNRQCLPSSSPGRESSESGEAPANRKTSEGSVSEEYDGEWVSDWGCETRVIAASQASLSPKSVKLAHYEIFRKNFGLTSLKLYLHLLFMKSFVQESIMAHGLDQYTEPALCFELLSLTCTDLW